MARDPRPRSGRVRPAPPPRIPDESDRPSRVQPAKPKRRASEVSTGIVQPPPPARTTPDARDLNEQARERNIRRGASPHGGPGRTTRRRAKRILKRVATGKASIAELQRHLRSQGFNIAVDNVLGPETQAAWQKYTHTLARGEAQNIEERQRRYLRTALTRPGDYKTEVELFGEEGQEELERARARLRRLELELRKATPEPEEPEGFLERAVGALDPRRIPDAIEAIGEWRPRDDVLAAREATGELVDRAIAEGAPALARGTFRELTDVVRDDPTALAGPQGLVEAIAKRRESQEWGIGPESAKLAHGEEADPRWLAFEAALIPFRPLGALKGALAAAGMLRFGDHKLAAAAAKAAYKSHSRVREYAVGKHAARREAARSMSGRGLERLSDVIGNTERRAGKELRYSTKFRMDLMEVTPQVLRSYKNRLRRIGRRVDSEQEYALRILSEGMTPEERITHHLNLAENAPLPHIGFYHLKHAELTEKAGRYVQLNPEWTPGVDVQTVPRIILRKDAPRQLKEAWSWFRETGALREGLLQELAGIEDGEIMSRLARSQIEGRRHAPGRVISGARFKTFEEKAKEELEADPARQQAFAWIDANIEDPMEAQGIKAFFDHYVRSAAEVTGEPIPSILSRISGVEAKVKLEDIPELEAFYQTAPAPTHTAPFIASREIADKVLGEKHAFPKGMGAATLARKIDEIYSLVRQGADYRDWYARMAAVWGKVASDLGVDPKAFAQVTAIYSRQANPTENLRRAVVAIRQFQETGKIELGLPGQADKAMNVLNGGAWEGRKTNSYYASALKYLDPEAYQREFSGHQVVVDRHISRLFTGDTPGRFYDGIERVFQEMADQLGWAPEEVQAAAWVPIKARGMHETVLRRGKTPRGGPEAYMESAADAYERGYDRYKGELFQREAQRLKGLPTTGRNYGPNPEVQDLAQAYSDETGIPYNRPDEYVPVQEGRAKRIAVEYARMLHDPDNPHVRDAYQALIKETFDQYFMLERAGYKFEFPEGEYPYKSPWDAMQDLRENKHLYVFPTESGFGTLDNEFPGHPLLADSGIEWGGRPVTHNDIFRAVHDVFGHHKEGVGFRADGEENAWRQHSAMYSDLARKAMTTETRGQNSWVNFGPHGAANQAANEVETVYADQKAGLLPQWVVNEGSGNDPYAKLSSGAYHEEALRREGEDVVTGAEDLLKEQAERQFGVPAEAAGIMREAREKGFDPTDPDTAEGGRMLGRIVKLIDSIEDDELRAGLHQALENEVVVRDAGNYDEFGEWINNKLFLEELVGTKDLQVLRAIANELPPVQGVTREMHGLPPESTVIPEHDLERRINQALENEDYEEAQALHNLLTGQGKQIPGVERRTTEGELFQASFSDDADLPYRKMTNKDLEGGRPYAVHPLWSEVVQDFPVVAAKDLPAPYAKAWKAYQAERGEPHDAQDAAWIGIGRLPLEKVRSILEQTEYRKGWQEADDNFTRGAEDEFPRHSEKLPIILGEESYYMLRDGYHRLHTYMRDDPGGDVPVMFPVADAGKALPQRGGNLDIVSPYGIKGAAAFDPDDIAKIFLTEAADATTIPHEIAHVMRRALPLMPERMEQSIAKWLGAPMTNRVERSAAKKAGKPMPRATYEYTREAEEKFAKAWEAMIYRGLEPPGAKKEFTVLAKVFQEILEEGEFPNVPPQIASMLRRMVEFEPKPGGAIMGAEDILYGVEYAPTFRGMPFRPVTEPHKQLGAYVRRATSLFGGGRRQAVGRGPDDVHLRRAYHGAALLSGFFKRDVIDPKADSATLAIRISAAAVARKALVDAGEELPRFADDVAVKIDPAKDAPKELGAFWDKVSELGSRKLSQKDLDGVNFDLIEQARASVLPAEIDGKPISQVAQELLDTERPIENIVWVPREFVEASGLRYVPKSAKVQEAALRKWLERGGLTWDVINDMVKAQILWLNPAYAPVQFIGNTVMNLMHQGPFAIVSGYKSVMMMREMELAERLTLDTAMGEGITAGIRPRSDVLGLGDLFDVLHHYNSVAADVFPRRMAFMHEARRDGLKDLGEIGALLKAAREGDEEALQRVELIARRARRSIVDFDRLSPFERDVVSRWIFFYPWLRGATDYSINFIKDHPIQAAAIALMYEHFKAAQQDIIGDHPYYSNLDVPISTDTVGLKVPWTDMDVSLSDAAGEHTWRDPEGRPMVFKMRQALTQTTPLELAQSLGSFSQGIREGGLDVVGHLTPVPYAAGVALFGFDPYEDKEVKPGPLTFLNQISPSTMPLVDRVKQIWFTSPEERAEANEKALYPRERMHHALRLGLGSLAPTPYNVEEGESRRRELKPAFERHVEELQLDAEHYGVEPPSEQVIEDLRYRTELFSGWRNLDMMERARRSAELFDRRHGTNQMVPYVDGLQNDAQAKAFYENINPKIYPWLLAYERMIERLEDAAIASQ